MAYNPTTWIDGTTPVDASHLNALEGGVADNASAIDELNSYVKIENLGTLQNVDLFDVMTEWASQYGTGESQFNIAMFHVMSTSTVENLPSSAFNYGNGFIIKGRDTASAIMFSYQSPYSIATIGSAMSSLGTWGQWTIK